MICKKILGPSIELDKVSFRPNEQCLLDDLSLSFEAGKWHGIVGPNGGGKSTLIKTILGFNGHQGQVSIVWPEGKRGRIGYIPQLVAFDASLPISMQDYLLMSLQTRPVWFKRQLPQPCYEALESLGLSNKLKHKLGDLSGGERQRLMLASALLKQPSLLILDEPMTGLDEAGRAQSLNLLSQFKAVGGTLLMIEHERSVIQAYCDQVIWVDKQARIMKAEELDNLVLGHAPAAQQHSGAGAAQA